MTMKRLATCDIPRAMSHKNNKSCHGLILVLIVGFFGQFFVSYLFGRTVLQFRDMILRLRNLWRSLYACSAWWRQDSMFCGIFLSKSVWFYFNATLIVLGWDQFDGDSFLNKRTRCRPVDSVLRPSILSKVDIMTIARLPTYDIPLGMSHKNNKSCHHLNLVLIVVFFWPMFC